MNAEYHVDINSTLKWQACFVFVALLVSVFFTMPDSSICFGGAVVMLSTWHVFRSVVASGGEKSLLMQAAGMRFAVFLVVLATGLFVFELQAILVLVGMVSAYVGLYAHGLAVIYRRMKGS